MVMAYPTRQNLKRYQSSNADSDNDGINDGLELANNMNPLNGADVTKDSDNDGKDGDEILRGTNPKASDSDGDGISDQDEIVAGLDPVNADSDGDGQSVAKKQRRGPTQPIATAPLWTVITMT